ncbi:MAG: leucine-rich repeat domain-containing protein [Pontiellaceae bacterium]|nr:leucine-rich repeat domain-containing protein [Pontiellaceae bacterium]
MRRIVGLIGTGLFAATFLFMVPAAQALQYEDLSYTSDGTSITITDCSTSATNVVIPATIDNLPVTAIGSYALRDCTSLTSIAIPASVISIRNSAFSRCTCLACIDVDGANPSFSSLDGVLFNKDQSILIRYPAGKTADSYTIPISVSDIGAWAFGDCISLFSIVIPDSVRSIGEASFDGCTSLASLAIPDGVTSTGFAAFSGCTSLTNVAIPGSVTFISSYSFQYCSNLTSIAIPAGVTDIGEGAFCGCTSLTSITIPDRVSFMGGDVFFGCTSLASLYFAGNAPCVLPLYLFDVTDNATIYYLPGTSGWGNIFFERPVVLWNPTIDVGEGFGAGENGFGFDITGTADIPVVIEACTNLAEGIWIPLQTNTLSSGTLQFNDPGWTNHPSRIYRISGP